MTLQDKIKAKTITLDELLEKIEHIDMSERIRWDNIL